MRIWRRGMDKSLREASREIGIPLATLQRVENNHKSGDGTGSGLDGGTLARLLRWLLDDEKPTVTTAHDKQKRPK
jgi:hypothetical protein